MERVSTFGLGQAMLRSALSVQNAFSTTSTQKASGLVATTYGDLGRKASTLISTEASLTQLRTWKSNTQIANDRTQSMYSAVDSMIDQLTSLRATLSAAKSSAGRSGDLNKIGNQLLQDLAGQMNVRLDGRYLFAGSNTDKLPVDTSLLTPATVPSSADPAYYTGDTHVASVRVSTQQTINYGVTGDNDSFEKALRTANILANMSISPVDLSAVDEAFDLASKAIDGLIAIQSGLSTSASRLEAAMVNHTASMELFENISSQIKEVDVAEATVKITAYQTQLEASYSALAKVNELSLTKYL